MNVDMSEVLGVRESSPRRAGTVRWLIVVARNGDETRVSSKHGWKAGLWLRKSDVEATAKTTETDKEADHFDFREWKLSLCRERSPWFGAGAVFLMRNPTYGRRCAYT